MTRQSVWAIAVVLAVLVHSILDTVVTASAVTSHFPSLSPGTLNVLLTLARAIQLTMLLFAFEWVLLRMWARRILGHWAYYSESGNFGLARIKVASGRLKYTVELYKTAEEVIGALRKEESVSCFAHVSSIMSEYSNGEFYTDYHIDYADKSFLPRKGLLRLIPTENPKRMDGYWHSTVESKYSELRKGTLKFLREDAFVKVYCPHGHEPAQAEAGGPPEELT